MSKIIEKLVGIIATLVQDVIWFLLMIFGMLSVQILEKFFLLKGYIVVFCVASAIVMIVFSPIWI